MANSSRYRACRGLAPPSKCALPGTPIKSHQYFRIGDKGKGTLNITNGGTVTNDTYEGAISSGEVTVSGTGSTWTNTNGLFVGGKLNITDGGKVTSNEGGNIGPLGEVTVTGSSSTWTDLNSWRSGSFSIRGNLNILDGGVVSSTYNDKVHIADGFKSTGTVTIDGINSIWDIRNKYGMRPSLYIGGSGEGTLTITNGGTVHSGDSSIQSYLDTSTSRVVVDRKGAKWNTYELHVGSNSTLNITNGGRVNSTDGYINHDLARSGEVKVTVDGVGSVWNIVSEQRYGDGLVVGYYGTGLLNIINGGTVIVNKETWIARRPTASGTIHFDNGTLTTGGFLGAMNDLTGTGTINAHGLVSDIDLVFDATHSLTQTLTINKNANQNITINMNANGSGAMGAGYHGNGSMRIADGIVVESRTGYIGYKSSSTGEVFVDGIGSAWNIKDRQSLFIGYYGNGQLHITNGGHVTVDRLTRTAYQAGSAGTIHFDNGTLTTGEFHGEMTHLTGTGTINTHGLISDIDLVFDATHGLKQTLILRENENQNITLNLDVDGKYAIGAGYNGTGTLRIADGVNVESMFTYIGFNSDSVGTVTVDGTNSKWTNTTSLNVGRYGSGILNITNGGLVSVQWSLTIDSDKNGDSFINMANGGMLAKYGEIDDSLTDFLGRIGGTDAIRYWDGSIGDWANITGATYGQDYTLAYLTEGDLAGYTVLTVTAIPEPTTLAMLGLVSLVAMRRRK